MHAVMNVLLPLALIVAAGVYTTKTHFFTAAPMLTIYPILGAIYSQQTFCVNTLVATTLASGVTLSIVVALFNS